MVFSRLLRIAARGEQSMAIEFASFYSPTGYSCCCCDQYRTELSGRDNIEQCQCTNRRASSVLFSSSGQSAAGSDYGAHPQGQLRHRRHTGELHPSRRTRAKEAIARESSLGEAQNWPLGKCTGKWCNRAHLRAKWRRGFLHGSFPGGEFCGHYEPASRSGGPCCTRRRGQTSADDFLRTANLPGDGKVAAHCGRCAR